MQSSDPSFGAIGPVATPRGEFSPPLAEILCGLSECFEFHWLKNPVTGKYELHVRGRYREMLPLALNEAPYSAGRETKLATGCLLWTSRGYGFEMEAAVTLRAVAMLALNIAVGASVIYLMSTFEPKRLARFPLLCEFFAGSQSAPGGSSLPRCVCKGVTFYCSKFCGAYWYAGLDQFFSSVSLSGRRPLSLSSSLIDLESSRQEYDGCRVLAPLPKKLSNEEKQVAHDRSPCEIGAHGGCRFCVKQSEDRAAAIAKEREAAVCDVAVTSQGVQPFYVPYSEALLKPVPLQSSWLKPGERVLTLRKPKVKPVPQPAYSGLVTPPAAPTAAPKFQSRKPSERGKRPEGQGKV